ncbi:MAG: SPFH domain-containing protein [Planctomycetes bacterium]|nr:SPFH domain-containing protein [Planctomycetota bacterium]
MGFWDQVRGEFIDIVEWLDDGSGALAVRFERHQNEIKNGAQLLVRPGQAAVFVREGVIADVFGPGRTILETANLPILSTLLGSKHGFESPFKAEVIFVRTTRVTDLKWGTSNPVLLRDLDLGMARLRAFGSFAIEVRDPRRFVERLVGTDQQLHVDELHDALRQHVVARFSDLAAEKQIPLLEIAAHADELAAELEERARESFREYGLELCELRIENLSLPPEVERAIDERARMGALGDLGAYQQMQAADAMLAAARNEADGGAGSGLGMGLGFGLGNQMARGPMAPEATDANVPPRIVEEPPEPAPTRSGRWWIARDGQPSGPYDESALRFFVERGALRAESLVWMRGMAQWAPASRVPELQELLLANAGELPPPLPPQA